MKKYLYNIILLSLFLMNTQLSAQDFSQKQATNGQQKTSLEKAFKVLAILSATGILVFSAAHLLKSMQSAHAHGVTLAPESALALAGVTGFIAGTGTLIAVVEACEPNLEVIDNTTPEREKQGDLSTPNLVLALTSAGLVGVLIGFGSYALLKNYVDNNASIGDENEFFNILHYIDSALHAGKKLFKATTN